MAEARPGDVILLTDGERNLSLRANLAETGALNLNLHEYSPELAAELLTAAKGPFTAYSRQDLEAIAERVFRERNRE